MYMVQIRAFEFCTLNMKTLNTMNTTVNTRIPELVRPTDRHT